MNQQTKLLFVGGDNESFPVVERGKCYIGIPGQRFEWEAWDGKIDPRGQNDNSPADEPEPVDGRDIVGIAQLTADSEGRAALDKDHRPDGKYFCVAWTASGKTRILQTVRVTNFGAEETQRRKDSLPSQEQAAQVAAEPSQTATSAKKQSAVLHRIEKMLAENITALTTVADQTAPSNQVKNTRRAIQLDRTERDKAKKKPGGQRKPGGERALKVVMRAIQRKKDSYTKEDRPPPGVGAMINELREYGRNIPWSTGYLRNRFSRWDSKKDDFRN